jgi:hypothetical protein
MNNGKIFTFNHEFYKTTYTDLINHNIIIKKDILQHYLQYGKREKRSICKEEIIYNYNKNLQESTQKIREFKETKIKFFNILIRTSNRPNYFKKCIASILNQLYSNYHVYICYDKNESLSYLDEYKTNDKITYFHVNDKSLEKYKFNLYCNRLLDKVTKGFVIFLDDDNYFVSNDAFNILNISMNKYKILTWKFIRPDKLIYKEDLNEPLVLGEIDTSNVCFNSSIKNNSKWKDKQYGDFNYFKPLFDNCDIKDKKFLDLALTSTQFSDKIGNFGENN